MTAQVEPALARRGAADRWPARFAVMDSSVAGQIGWAVATGTNFYPTADIRYHQAQQAQAAGLGLIVLNQFAGEELIGAGVADYSQTKLDCPVRLSASRTTPWEVSRP